MEAMLKTAMQSKLDGVRSGLNQFQLALQGLKEIKEKYKSDNMITELLSFEGVLFVF